MRRIVLIGIIGLLSQFIDGSLGMAYGATTATLLLVVGISPVITSMLVHLAEIGTTFVSGVAHHRFGNVDWRMVRWLGVPGSVGAILGAYVLTNLNAAVARPWMACFLFAVGVFILVTYSLRRDHVLQLHRQLRARFLVPLGLFAGFFDAAGGGGWGPVGTSTLLASRRVEPRKVVGTIDTSEFLIAASASAGFLLSRGTADVPWAYVLALLAGGLIAAPIAAWLVRKLHPRVLGTAAGGVIAITNLRTVLGLAGVGGGASTTTLVFVIVSWLALLTVTIVRLRRMGHRIV